MAFCDEILSALGGRIFVVYLYFSLEIIREYAIVLQNENL